MNKIKISYYEEKSKLTGRSSFILIHYNGSFRRKESLKIYCQTKPKNPLEKKERENALLIVNQIVNEKRQELLRGAYDIPEQYHLSEDFYKVAEVYTKKLEATGTEVKKHRCVIKKLKEYTGKDILPCYEVTESLLSPFVKSMENNMRGETAQGYLNRLKIIIKAATSDNYFRKNPALNIKARKMGAIHKAVLTVDEIRTLWMTPLGNDEVRRAFLFACTTALRFCDVNNLLWSDISNGRLSIVQKKTKQALILPLTDEALSLLGERGGDEDRVFNLPSHTAVMKWMRKWTELAGVDKKITFHVARHSLATNLISQNVNLAVTSKILGHCNISQTQRYVRISEELKLQALNQISFSKP